MTTKSVRERLQASLANAIAQRDAADAIYNKTPPKAYGQCGYYAYEHARQDVNFWINEVYNIQVRLERCGQ